MAESKEERVARLLEKGLEIYGDGDVAQAILAWEEALVLDPKNNDAVDYIKTADRRTKPRPPKASGSSPAISAIASEARQLMTGGELDAAFELLTSASESQPSGLELHALLDLVRARLLDTYLENFGDQSGVPALAGDGTDLTKFNLPSDAGFLLSMMDGSTRIADLISLSGMDDFDALRLLHGLCDAGIVEISR